MGPSSSSTVWLDSPPHWGPHSLQLQKKGSHLQPSGADSVCCRRTAKGFCGRRMCICMHLSLPPNAAIPLFLYNTTSLFSPSAGPPSFISYPPPILLPFRNNLSVIVSPSAMVFHSLKSNNLSVSFTQSLLPCSKAALSVALFLNSARLNASTWLHVHTPTFMAKEMLLLEGCNSGTAVRCSCLTLKVQIPTECQQSDEMTD